MPCNNRAKKGLIGAIFMLVPANLIIWKHVTMSRFHKNSGALALFKPCQGRRYFEAERLIRRFAISCAKGMPRACQGLHVASLWQPGSQSESYIYIHHIMYIIYIYNNIYRLKNWLKNSLLGCKTCVWPGKCFLPQQLRWIPARPSHRCR